MSQSPDRQNNGGSGDAGPPSFERGMLDLMPSLRRYARSLTRSDADGEDLLQDSLERALVKRGQWSGSSLKAWAFSIMTNLYRNDTVRTARRRTAPLDEAHDVPSTLSPAGDPLERRRLTAAIDSLAPDFRAVLMLVVIESMSYREVATLLQIPEGTVMSRLARARAQIARYLEADNVIPLRRSE
ncbi:RNA polymerase sigma factor [Rhizobium sp. C4]|uniref:RNA polymerase sigma factor n=1 Tax=Rhizobium sp. C4 TaxID=1349800 RepID=UPI001E5F58CE|nr:RNA polymerase sigma factor [Rhizobium sp. C4]